MKKTNLELLIAIGKCHRLLKEFGINLRRRSTVKEVTHYANLNDLADGFRLEEYVDAELTNGISFSWRVETTITIDEFAIVSDVRQIYEGEQDLVAEVADRTFKTTEECVQGLVDITLRLINTDPRTDKGDG
jgi:hypothetical protein